jgi:hypothetical protein
LKIGPPTATFEDKFELGLFWVCFGFVSLDIGPKLGLIGFELALIGFVFDFCQTG